MKLIKWLKAVKDIKYSDILAGSKGLHVIRTCKFCKWAKPIPRNDSKVFCKNTKAKKSNVDCPTKAFGCIYWEDHNA